MIELKDFSIGFGERKLLSDVSTSFFSGKLTALIGKNGTGKSTLIKALCGLNKKYTGEIFIDGINLKEITGTNLASKIAYVNTQRPRLANLKCIDIISLGRSPYSNWLGNVSGKDKEIIEKSLDMIGMKDYAKRNFNSLSDGESQKIMIARAIAQETNIIILDEPTSFLDLPTRFELAELLKKLANEGKTILFSTHELDIALRFSDYIALITPPSLMNLPSQEMKEFLQSSHHPYGLFL